MGVLWLLENLKTAREKWSAKRLKISPKAARNAL